MKAAISGETLGSVMELDEILSLFQKNGIHFIEIRPENIPVKGGKGFKIMFTAKNTASGVNERFTIELR